MGTFSLRRGNLLLASLLFCIAPSTRAADEASDAETGRIAGVTQCEGRVPPMRPIDMSVDPVCDGQHSEDAPALNESIVVDDAGHLANVFVCVVEGVPEGDYPAPEEAVELSQAGCMYHPRVFGIRPGQPIAVLNPDGNIHNVNGMPTANPGFNLAMDAETKRKVITLEKPEAPFPIKCDVHPWMRAYCAVVAHPFFAVSSTDGNFTMPSLPPGTYVLEAWHERFGVRRQEVTVTAGETTEITFTFSR